MNNPAQAPTFPSLLSDSDLATILVMTVNWVRSHAREIPGFRELGPYFRFCIQEAEQWLGRTSTTRRGNRLKVSITGCTDGRAVGSAPGGYSRDPAIASNLAALRAYLRSHYDAQPLLNKIVALWASAHLHDLLTREQREQVIGEIDRLQREDGGWSLFAFAGLWDSWKDKETGKTLETYTVVTTDPNELMESIHTRMPVILAQKDYERWMEPGEPTHPPVDLLWPYPPRR